MKQFQDLFKRKNKLFYMPGLKVPIYRTSHYRHTIPKISEILFLNTLNCLIIRYMPAASRTHMHMFTHLCIILEVQVSLLPHNFKVNTTFFKELMKLHVYR